MNAQGRYSARTNREADKRKQVTEAIREAGGLQDTADVVAKLKTVEGVLEWKYIFDDVVDAGIDANSEPYKKVKAGLAALESYCPKLD